MIKFSSKIDEQVWKDFKALAHESHQQISGLLTEALSEYLQKKRVRSSVLTELEKSIEENEELGKLLAR